MKQCRRYAKKNPSNSIPVWRKPNEMTSHLIGPSYDLIPSGLDDGDPVADDAHSVGMSLGEDRLSQGHRFVLLTFFLGHFLHKPGQNSIIIVVNIILSGQKTWIVLFFSGGLLLMVGHLLNRFLFLVRKRSGEA